MGLIQELRDIVGPAQVLTGPETGRYATDWTGQFSAAPLAVVRPADTDQTARLLALADRTGTPVVPVAGNTGLTGGTLAEGALMISVERMNRIRAIRPAARIAVVEAGVILSTLHTACAAEGLVFPLTFGARGSAMIGGVLATNAGGSNVLRHGNARALCLGIEAVLPGGEVLDLMSELHKDNSGYDLRDLLIGSEGTLGLITGAVLRLAPQPGAYATAMVAMTDLADALVLLNRLQEATGGAVEAMEFMPASYIDQHLAAFPQARAPFAARHPVNILVEIGATAPRDATPAEDGSLPIVEYLQETLAALMQDGLIADAVVAQTQGQRAEMWARREAAAELSLGRTPFVTNDVALPLDRVAPFLARMDTILPGLDPGAGTNIVSHLGDGNVHYTVWLSDAALKDRVMEAVEDEVLALGGSFSAEHGIGLVKRPSMARRKPPAALAAMRAIKTALDPNGIMNPGKVLP